MTARASIRMADLRRAARLAWETGQEVAIEDPQGRTWRIAPPGGTVPVGATARESAECDKAFGVE